MLKIFHYCSNNYFADSLFRCNACNTCKHRIAPPPRHTPPPRNVVGMSKGKSLQKNRVNALCCHLAILCTSVSLSNFKLVQNLQKFFSKASAFFSSFSFLSKYNFPVKGYQDRIVDKSQICSPGDLK